MICNIILIYQRKEESLYPDLALAAVLIPGKIMPYHYKNHHSLILNALDNDFSCMFRIIGNPENSKSVWLWRQKKINN